MDITFSLAEMFLLVWAILATITALILRRELASMANKSVMVMEAMMEEIKRLRGIIDEQSEQSDSRTTH